MNVAAIVSKSQAATGIEAEVAIVQLAGVQQTNATKASHSVAFKFAQSNSALGLGNDRKSKL